MWLPAEKPRLHDLSESKLRDAIFERRSAIRVHRDAMGDDRCWLDDYLVWGLVEGLPMEPPDAVRYDESGMAMCRGFYRHRRAEDPDPVPADAILDADHWDDDIWRMSQTELVDELARIQSAIKAHHENSPVTIKEDRVLYAILPEKMPADFRLPPEEKFLGEALAPRAGCPSFWRSHAKCGEACDLHKWGPCT
jgi:hypothetical protein